MAYAEIMGKSCGEEEEEEEDEEGETTLQDQELEKQKLLFHQARLANCGVAEMVLLHVSAARGLPSEMVMKTLSLGIAILRGSNIDCQAAMLNYLKEKKDASFFLSIAGLMNSCSVLDLDAFERNTKAEGLGVGADGCAGEKNMHDAEFTCALFRFIQLTCEGHNLDWQNYLRTQAGNTTTVSVINCTVDYLLRLQESIMDFYWHYSSKEIIDPAGKANFFKAIGVASQSSSKVLSPSQAIGVKLIWGREISMDLSTSTGSGELRRMVFVAQKNQDSSQIQDSSGFLHSVLTLPPPFSPSPPHFSSSKIVLCPATETARTTFRLCRLLQDSSSLHTCLRGALDFSKAPSSSSSSFKTPLLYLQDSPPSKHSTSFLQTS